MSTRPATTAELLAGPFAPRPVPAGHTLTVELGRGTGYLIGACTCGFLESYRPALGTLRPRDAALEAMRESHARHLTEVAAASAAYIARMDAPGVDQFATRGRTEAELAARA